MASPNRQFSDRNFAQRAAGSLMPHDDRLTLRQSSFSSDSSTASQITALAINRSSPSVHDDARAAASSSSLGSTLRPVTSDLPLRQLSPAGHSPSELNKHRNRHSQGFFEPTLPTASFSQSPNGSLTASQIAAQAAISSSHARRRSQTIPEPQPTSRPSGRRKPSFPPPKAASPTMELPLPMPPHTAHPAGGLSAATTAATAATAANVAFPRSPLYSPAPPFAERMPSPASDRDQRSVKEKSRRNIFSKPKAIMTSKDDKRSPAIPSPNKNGLYSSNPLARLANQSTSSLTETILSSASSLYSSNNASTSTLVPSSSSGYPEKDKDRHRPHFLSRKTKTKDKDDQFIQALSSASSNSRPTDPHAPIPLYSFAPASPAPQSTFDRSISGFDLRHGGRALREKRKQEKSGNTVTFAAQPTSAPAYGEGAEWLTVPGANLFGPSSASSILSQGAESGTSGGSFTGLSLSGMSAEDAWPLLQARILNIFEGEDIRIPIEDFNRLVSVHLQRCIQRRAPAVILDDLSSLLRTGFSSLDQTLRLIPDERLVLNLVDMWLYVFGTILPFMQAIFLPLDLELRGHGQLMNSRESAEFWKPVLKQPQSGLASAGLAPATRGMVEVRTMVLLAFRNVVILPRHATLLAIFSRLSLDSINALPLTPKPNEPNSAPPRPDTSASSTSGGTSSVAAANLNPAEASFTSQSSTLLDSNHSTSLGARSRATSNTSAGSFHSNGSQPQRHVPGLLSSLRPQVSNFGSYDHPFTYGRDRANSSPGPPPISHAPRSAPIMDPAKVTETAGRMLQCISVLAGLPETGIGPGLTKLDFNSDNKSATNQPSSGALASSPTKTSYAATTSFPEQAGEDDSVAVRRQMERLAKELKLNWLGRGRTGRNRRGFVGTRVIRNVASDRGLGSGSSGMGLGIGVGA